jgi:hypothetical protein
MTAKTHKRTLLGREVDFPNSGKWTHVKSGGQYIVLFPAIVENGLIPAAAYSKADGDGLIWVRPITEFLDGRFVHEDDH